MQTPHFSFRGDLTSDPLASFFPLPPRVAEGVPEAFFLYLPPVHHRCSRTQHILEGPEGCPCPQIQQVHVIHLLADSPWWSLPSPWGNPLTLGLKEQTASPLLASFLPPDSSFCLLCRFPSFLLAHSTLFFSCPSLPLGNTPPSLHRYHVNTDDACTSTCSSDHCSEPQSMDSSDTSAWRSQVPLAQKAHNHTWKHPVFVAGLSCSL